ncbi:MAG: glycosyltransferase [Ignavibacteria bacterium]
MKKIKVLNIVTVVEDGGLEMLIYKIYKGLNKDLFQLDLCILTKMDRESFIFKDFKELGCNLYNLKFKNRNIGLSGFISNLNEIIKLSSIIRNNEYEVVHSHDFFPAFFARLAVILSRIMFSDYPHKVFVTYHNIYYWLKKPHRLINKLLSYFTNRIICVSESAKIDSLKTEKITENKYKVIYNGLDPTEFYKDNNLRIVTRKEYGYSENDFIIGNVGVLSVRKGQIYLLKAFNEVKDKYPDLKLLIAGSIRTHEIDVYNEILFFIKNNYLEDRVKIVEPIKEVNKIYNIIDLFVMCSITEGFGLSAFEHMLTEKRCLFSDIQVFKELTKDGQFGNLFENQNYLSLADKITEEIESYGKNTIDFPKYRTFVVENYNLNKMVKEYEEIYLDSR